MGCPLCPSVLAAHFEQHARECGFRADESGLTAYFVQRCEAVLPGLFELLQSPQHWIGALGHPWFPVDPQRVAKVKLHLKLVDAPLPFTGLVMRKTCSHCETVHSTVCINMRFYVLCAHMSGFLTGNGVNVQDFARFVVALHADNADWKGFEAPQHVDRDMLAFGMAWVLCHEVGHYAAPEHPMHPPFGVPHYVQQHQIAEELTMDAASFRMMVHRLCANAGLNGRAAYGPALCGVFLVLNAWSLLISPDWGRDPDVLAYRNHVDIGTPSPTLRWKTVKAIYDTLVLTGIANADVFPELEQRCFADRVEKSAELMALIDSLRPAA